MPIGMGDKRAGSYYNNYLNDKQRKRLKTFKKGDARQKARARMLRNSGIDLKKQKRLRKDVRQGKYRDVGRTPSHPSVAQDFASAPAVPEEVQQSLDPWQLMGFEQRRGEARREHGRRDSDFAFDLGLQELQRGRQLRDLTDTFRRSRFGINPAMASRGLLRSGITDRAFRLNREEEGRRYGDLDFDFEQAIGRIEENRRNNDTWLQDMLGDVNTDEQWLRGQELSDLRPMEDPYA